MEIKNLKKAATRIKKAIKNKERIILYGDSDLDGVSSILIIEQAIKSLGGSVAAHYFPQRDKEGYGLTRKALKKLQDFSPALIITADLGISNFEEVKLAKKAGFDVIIVDHHIVINGKLPEADVIVDPKQPGDEYPFKEFAACGLAFRLAEAMLGKSMSRAVRNSMVELAALGTIADMMPREGDNVAIVDEGMGVLQESWRPGIQVFFEMQEDDRIEKLISLLNVRDVKNGYPGAWQLLVVPTMEEAKKMLKRFLKKNVERKNRIHQLADQVRNNIRPKHADSIVFEGGKDFDFMLLGAVASIISQEYRKPTFLYLEKGLEGVGSVRAPSGFDTVEAMQSCSELLKTYGGHKQASGFRVPIKNLQKFRKGLIKHFQT